jgi:hypothetical protein
MVKNGRVALNSGHPGWFALAEIAVGLRWFLVAVLLYIYFKEA